MFERLNAAPWNDLQELVRNSYEMVAAKAPKKTSKKKRKAAGSR